MTASEQNPFQTAMRGWFAARVSLAVARAARIRQTRGFRGSHAREDDKHR